MSDRGTTTYATRTATLDDAPEMARLLTVLGHPTTPSEVSERWEEWSSAGNSALVVDGPDGRLAGLATLHQTAVLHRPRPLGRITALVVDPSVRGQGVGRAIVLAAEAVLRAAGCGLMEVTSNIRRTDAHAFYEHLGYERTSARFAKDLTSKD